MEENSMNILFQPFQIRNLEIKNRIVMAPMGNVGMVTDDGAYIEDAIDYFVERAKGGAGLIITGLVKVENEIEKIHMPTLPCITLNPTSFIKTATIMVERIHAYGSKIFIQLTAGLGRVGKSVFVEGRPIAPSPIPSYWNPEIICRELTTGEVETIVKRFGEAAIIAKSVGFDGIEIHAVHEGYLLDQFAIASFNRRTDKYGGDLKRRLRFAIEIVETIKSINGENFPVCLRYTIKSYIKAQQQGGVPNEEFKELGRDLEEGLEVAKILERAGYDAFNADAGSYEASYWPHPPNYQDKGCYLPLTEKLKREVHVPIIVAGKLNDPEVAKKALSGNQADAIALGRGLLADPYWPKKTMTGEVERIRPCLGCHDGCFGRILMGKPLSCTVNPAVGREKWYGIHLATNVKKVIVIGGGIAGLEAARVSAIRGHKVKLFEKSDKIGGHLVAGSIPDFKKEVKALIEWYRRELDELHVKIITNKEVTPQLVEKERPEIVFVATGSSPKIPNIFRMDHKNVATAEDILLGRIRAGDSIVIIGGGQVGCETALWLAKQSKKVLIVETLNDLMGAGMTVPHPNRIMLIDLLKFHQVDIYTNTSCVDLTENGVLVNTKEGRRIISADTIVLAIGYKPERELYRSIMVHHPDLYLIGDANEVRNIMYAIWDAYEVARNV